MFGNKTQILKVEGMMCMHCAAHVQQALESLSGVRSAKIDLATKTATVKVATELSEEVYREAIQNAGYVFGGLQK